MQRVAIVFDDSLRLDTTGTYCRRALESLVKSGRLSQVCHFRPWQLGGIRSKDFDLYIFIDDGAVCTLPSHLKPAVWWAIDSHVSFDRCLAMSRQADMTFAAQQRGAEQLVAAGIGNAVWMPLGCDPEVHGRREVLIRYDASFVGHTVTAHRGAMLNLLKEVAPNSFVGICDFRKMSEVYSASKIVFNCSVADDINMRFFEGLCSGSMLLTNDLAASGASEICDADKHYVAYSDSEDFCEKLRHYLANDVRRQEIGEAGRAIALERHTYQHRMEHLLQHAFASVSRRQDRPRQRLFKDSSYFDFGRPDVLACIPDSSRKILDIGCGNGRLGESIKRRQQAHVTGLELEPQAAQNARRRLDQVYVADVQSADFDFAAGQFDCVVCADILEHLRAPAILLEKLRRWLSPQGTLVVSLPNVRHHTVIRSLLAGNWTYESAGLLDEDHQRFFTRREIEKLMFRAGFAIRDVRGVLGQGAEEWKKNGCRPEVTFGPLQLRTSSRLEAEEFFTYQYLVTATPEVTPERGLTSIVLVTHNQIQCTKACLDSIRLFTDEPIELIIVDNGSQDGTLEYLRTLSDVRIVENDSNRGFPAAANQGIRVAGGEQVLLLNNDTIVTTGWLRWLLDALYSNSSIGLVGPVSNNVSGEQRIPVTYDDFAQIDGFAWDYSKAHRGVLRATDRLVGFCLLIKRDVLNCVGLLDERFGIGNFEDDDYCRRAIAAGFQAAIVEDSFVHHVGSATFRGSGIDQSLLLENNKRLFEDKWSSESSGPRIHPNSRTHSRSGCNCETGLEGNCNENGTHGSHRIRLSVCLIVRDNQDTIRQCLESIRPWVDEIVVVDTGSIDETAALCGSLGARVFHWPWRDSFSAARNESFRHARGEWIFWMDSDDTIPEACGVKLRSLADSEHRIDVMGYVMQVHCPGLSPDEYTAVDHVKLVRNRHDLRFEFHIHEQILPSIRRLGGEVDWTDIFVVHSGADHSPSGRARKIERDLKLLSLDLTERPEHPFVLFNLGMTYADVGAHQEAVHHLLRCIKVSGPEESHLRKAYAILVGSYYQLGNHDEATRTCEQGLTIFPSDKELLFRNAMLHHSARRLKDAELTYLKVLEEEASRHFSSVDVGLADYKARHNLAIVYEDMGRPDIAMEQWKKVLAERSGYEPALAAIGRLSRQMGDGLRPVSIG